MLNNNLPKVIHSCLLSSLNAIITLKAQRSSYVNYRLMKQNEDEDYDYDDVVDDEYDHNVDVLD